MRFINHFRMLFLSKADLEPSAPQIKMFDVYYTDPLIVGFHVKKDPCDVSPPIIGFQPTEEC